MYSFAQACRRRLQPADNRLDCRANESASAQEKCTRTHREATSRDALDIGVLGLWELLDEVRAYEDAGDHALLGCQLTSYTKCQSLTWS